MTSVGDDCLLLAYAHVAHNCRVGNDVTMSNLAQLAGHVVVEDHAGIGAMAGVHQFVRIGALRVRRRLREDRARPPAVHARRRQPAAGATGLNRVGLRRAGFSRESLAELKEAYKIDLPVGNQRLARAHRRAA